MPLNSIVHGKHGKFSVQIEFCWCSKITHCIYCFEGNFQIIKKKLMKTITSVWIIPCCRHLFNIYYYRQTISLLTIVNTELVQPAHSERWSQLSLILLLLVFSVWLQGLKFSWKVLWITAGIKNFSQENARNAAVGVAAHNL